MHNNRPETPGTQTDSTLRLVAILQVSATVLIAFPVIFFLWQGEPKELNGFAQILYVLQDHQVAFGSALSLLLMAMAVRRTPAHDIPSPVAMTISRMGDRLIAMLQSRRIRIVLLLLVIGLCWAGHYAVFDNYNLSRDEQMVDFDAAIYASGQLFEPVPAAWRPVFWSLNGLFILPVAGHQAWVSAYLPGNAGLHALVGSIADPALTAPLLAALTLAALWHIGRQLWPDQPLPQATAMLLLLLSAQFLTTAMTRYAMTAHLAFNLLWLALFLRRRWWADIAAIFVGIIATGLHQPLFHPMFVGPFLLLLLYQRDWRRFALFAACYLVIGLGWLMWPGWISTMAGAGVAAKQGAGVSFAERLSQVTLNPFANDALWLMLRNGARFILWQHILLLPLLVLGLRASRRNPMAAALALGLVLPPIALFILLPYQGYGWGYRYMHGVIGNAALLGGFGMAALMAKPSRTMAHVVPMLLAASSATSIAVIAVYGFSTAAIVRPYAALDRLAAAQPVDWVLIDDNGGMMVEDVAFNSAALNRRPIRLTGRGVMRVSDWTALCKGRRFTYLSTDQMRSIADLYGPLVSLPKRDARARDILVAAGCTPVAVKPLAG